MSSSAWASTAVVLGVVAFVFFIAALSTDGVVCGVLSVACVLLVFAVIPAAVFSLLERNESHRQTMKATLTERGFTQVYIKKVTSPTTAFVGLPAAAPGCRLKVVRIGGLWQLNKPMDTYQSVTNADDMATWPSVARWCQLP